MPLAFLSLNLAHVMTHFIALVFLSPHVRLSSSRVLPHFIHSGAKCYAFWSLVPQGGYPHLIHEGLCVGGNLTHETVMCSGVGRV